MGRIALGFANASCVHCVRVVTRRLEETDGIRMVEFDTDALRIVVDFDPSRLSPDAIRAMLERSGYPTTLLNQAQTIAGRGTSTSTAA